MDTAEKFVLGSMIFVFVLFVYFFGHGVGYEKGKREMRFLAVQYGYAEYFISDPSTGETDWRWKK